MSSLVVAGVILLSAAELPWGSYFYMCMCIVIHEFMQRDRATAYGTVVRLCMSVSVAGIQCRSLKTKR